MASDNPSHIIRIEEFYGKDEDFVYPCTSWNHDALSNTEITPQQASSGPFYSRDFAPSMAAHLVSPNIVVPSCGAKLTAWSVDDVCEFLELNKLGMFVEAFRKEQVEGLSLPVMDINTLFSMFGTQFPKGQLLKLGSILGSACNLFQRNPGVRNRIRLVVQLNSSVSSLRLSTMVGRVFGQVSCFWFHIQPSQPAFAFPNNNNNNGNPSNLSYGSLIRQLDLRCATLLGVTQNNNNNSWGTSNTSVGYMSPSQLCLLFEGPSCVIHESQRGWAETTPITHTTLPSADYAQLTTTAKDAQKSSLVFSPARSIRYIIDWTTMPDTTPKWTRQTHDLFATHIRKIAVMLFCTRKFCPSHPIAALDIHVLSIIMNLIVQSSELPPLCIRDKIVDLVSKTYEPGAPLKTGGFAFGNNNNFVFQQRK